MTAGHAVLDPTAGTTAVPPPIVASVLSVTAE